jgi:hypothetical protein
MVSRQRFRLVSLVPSLALTLAHCDARAPEDGGADATLPADSAGDALASREASLDVTASPSEDSASPDASPDADFADRAEPDGSPGTAMDASALRDAAVDARADAGPDAGPDAAVPAGPRVDRSMPQLYSFSFRPSEADPMARAANGLQPAFLDTRVAPVGRLVVYLHGAGAPATCGSTEHQRLLSSWGFHVIGPCYVSDYGVSNCGADIRGCRLEAFDGTDRHPFVNIAPADSIETRVTRALEHLQRRNPAGDWQYFLDRGRPRWSAITLSGISHGASSAGVISQVRAVERAVMLSGPLDTGQAWLSASGMTPAGALWGFTHTADGQHMGHLAAFTALRLTGAPAMVDTTASPYGGSHRLVTSAMTTDGHSSTQAGGSSPRDAMGRYRFEPAWRRMYGAP